MAFGDDQMEMDENEGAQRSAKLTSKDKMPKTPDFSELMGSPKRGSPFVLDDFRGVNAYKKTSP